jgi:UDP-glucose 4-epimerase
MKYLITGGAGFVGSHLSQLLLDNGHEVTVVDDLSTGSRSKIGLLRPRKQLRFYVGSVLDEKLMESLVQDSDHVFHLAAAVGVFTIVNKPIESLRTNIRGSEVVTELCRKYSKPLLVTSTSEIYGKNTQTSLAEDADRVLGSPLISRWTYSEAKAIEEMMAFSLYVQHGIPARIVRLFNTVGPGQSGDFGMVIPRFIRAALENAPIQVFGDGSQTRCFGHVLDVVEAIYLVSLSQATIGEVVNIGNPVEVSILDLAKQVVERLNSKSEIVFIPYHEAYSSGFEDMLRRVPNIDKINRLTGGWPSRSLNQVITDSAAALVK